MRYLKYLVNLYGRAFKLMFRPAAEFERIAVEPESIASVITRWVLPLVAIMLLVNVVRVWIFGIGISAEVNGKSGEIETGISFLEGVYFTLPLLARSLIMVCVTGLVLYGLVPLFGGTRNMRQAVRTAAYIGTPAWLIGLFGPLWDLQAFSVRPPRSIGLFLGAFWGIWLLVRALRPMLQVPSMTKSLLNTGAAVVILTLLWPVSMRTTFGVISDAYMSTGSGFDEWDRALDEASEPVVTNEAPVSSQPPIVEGSEKSAGLEANFERCRSDLTRIREDSPTPYEAYCLGFGYQFAIGRNQDSERAVTWFRRAANQDYAPAQAVLGYMLEKGTGTDVDVGEALLWYRRSAERDDPDGLMNLGRAYEMGLAVNPDLAKARSYYQQSAALGNAVAQQALTDLEQRAR